MKLKFFPSGPYDEPKDKNININFLDIYMGHNCSRFQVYRVFETMINDILV